MAVCNVCGKRYLLRGLNRRLAIPEYRAMTGFWPWVAWRVCDGCLEAHERDFLERLRLLAPDVLENDEPVAGLVCLACGTVEPRHGTWHTASKWIGPDGRPARRAQFHLCEAHRGLPYVEGIVVPTNLTDASRMAAVLEELPVVGADLLARVEHWRPDDGRGPPEAKGFAAKRPRDEAARVAMDFWRESPDGMAARAAWLGPVRKDYRMRYRLDLVIDCVTGRRDMLVIVRLGPDRFGTYRTAPRAGGR